MEVALVTVGDELLAGDTENTNASWLGRQLTAAGATVTRVLTVPDEEAVIADAVARYHDAFDGVIVTGGIGGTPDDITKAAVARAFDRDLVVPDDVRAHLEAKAERFADDNPEMVDRYDMDLDLDAWASVPEGGQALLTDESFAAGCVIDRVYVLPGIPEELKAMYETIADEFDGDRTTETIHTPAPEGALVTHITAAREQFAVAVGSYPRKDDAPGRVKITGDDPATVADAAAWLREHIETE
ncbi:competence/damage-inducible protein A [Haloarcula argentinensis]|uniref:Competence damage-inducible protein A n=1 Tax=Haloarcula argentinensis TaxID=43776 RepID=A0A830FV67_HALAR|nr:molybdopterin-binding protein [Haloarcula argentinensis]EMA20883.1 competence-damage protein CinA-like protein [Haloarcula argentinensis DSM 12282]MDS0254917.1 molybdopterin-binding protein [Haloarcula argentinensis]GGM38085.1 competence damage-inducible protein A [Haloarcula argentinensis]